MSPTMTWRSDMGVPSRGLYARQGNGWKVDEDESGARGGCRGLVGLVVGVGDLLLGFLQAGVAWDRLEALDAHVRADVRLRGGVPQPLVGVLGLGDLVDADVVRAEDVVRHLVPGVGLREGKNLASGARQLVMSENVRHAPRTVHTARRAPCAVKLACATVQRRFGETRRISSSTLAGRSSSHAGKSSRSSNLT